LLSRNKIPVLHTGIFCLFCQFFGLGLNFSIEQTTQDSFDSQKPHAIEKSKCCCLLGIFLRNHAAPFQTDRFQH
jgi:hypothetical protein